MPDIGQGGSNTSSPIGRRIHLLLLEDEKESNEIDVQVAKLLKLLKQLKSTPPVQIKICNSIIRKRRRRKGRLKVIKNLFLQQIVRV